MEAAACWKQMPVDRRVFAAIVVLAPLLMGGLCFSVGRTTENFTVGCYVGFFLSTALIIGALIGWVVNFGRQVVFGDDESPGGLNPLQYVARQVARAIRETVEWVEAILTLILILVAMTVVCFMTNLGALFAGIFLYFCISSLLGRLCRLR